MSNPSTRRPLTPSQRALMETLEMLAAGSSEPGSTVTMSDRQLGGSGLTPTMVKKTMDQLIAANLVTKAWNADRYLWSYTLVPAPAAK